MRHRLSGRKLNRTSSHRLAMLRNMATSLFRHERITTTVPKAKELRPFAEKLITLAKRETLHARRQVLRHVKDREVVAKMFDTLGARYATRPGGYTRIIRVSHRRGDSAEMAIIELVDSTVEIAQAKKKAAPTKKKAPPKPSPAKKRGRRGTAREEALADVVAAEEAAEAAQVEEEEAEPEVVDKQEEKAKKKAKKAEEKAAKAEPDQEPDKPEESPSGKGKKKKE